MKENDLFLDFGDMPAATPKKKKSAPSDALQSKEQNSNSLNSQIQKKETIDPTEPARVTSKAKKEAQPTVSTKPAMKNDKKEVYHQYSPEEIMQSSVAYFHGDELAANVWMNKYALRDGNKIFELCCL